MRSKSRPRRHTPDVVVVGQAPIMQINVYDQLITLTRRTPSGAWMSYPVDASALASTLAHAPLYQSGLLALNTLAVGWLHGQPYQVGYSPAQVATLATPTHQYTIPLPPLVVGTSATHAFCWALPGPISEGSPLFLPPFPNIHSTGGICWGDVAPPAPFTPGNVLAAFLGSNFNAHLANEKSRAYPVSVIAHWERLAAEQATSYPEDDLIPSHRTLGWLIGGWPWR